MSWMQKLYRTYNEIEKNPNLSDLEKEKLAPLWHSPQNCPYSNYFGWRWKFSWS